MNGQVFEPDGGLYRVGADLTIEHQFNDVIIPNSIAFSPDDRVFYFSDTRRTKIWAFDFEIDEGRISNRRVFADASGHPGRPDGSTVDAEGFLWNAEIMGGRLVRYAPDGRIDRTVELPFDAADVMRVRRRWVGYSLRHEHVGRTGRRPTCPRAAFGRADRDRRRRPRAAGAAFRRLKARREDGS